MTSAIGELSSTILNPFDLEQLLHTLTSHAVAVTNSQGAGIMLARGPEGQLNFAAASDDRALEMELIQDRLEVGACYDAFVDNHLVMVEDLEGAGRWPAYEHRAAQSGVRAVLAVPMNAWGETIGVLSIYRDEPGPWTDDEVEAAQVLTSMGSGYALHANQIRAQHNLVDQLQQAIAGRDLIGQAKGILMTRDGLDADTAFDQLRAISQNQNRKLGDVAVSIVEAAAVGQHRTVVNGPASAAPASSPSSATRGGQPLDTDPAAPDTKAAAAGVDDPANKPVVRGSEAAHRRDEAARLRDESATSRDEVAVQRDEVAERRDAEADAREHVEPSGSLDLESGAANFRARSESCANAEERDRSAAANDQTADVHDAVEAVRNQQADDRDQHAEQRDREARAVERTQDIVTEQDARSHEDAVTAREDAASDRRASERDRSRGADKRTAAGEDRDASAEDRDAAGGDRHHAGQDRDAAATDRADAGEELATASLDALTGVYSRGPGMAELERDRSRADRAGEPFTLAFVDVDDLTGTNDRGGHPAGDRLLRQVADALVEHNRSHDVIVRYGGDEFACALTGLIRDEAAERLAQVNVALAEASERGSITVGLAQLEADESLASLIRRADADLYHQRRQRRAGDPHQPVMPRYDP